MLGIYITALLTSAFAFVGGGVFLHLWRVPSRERYVWLAFAVALFMQPLVYYAIRVPIPELFTVFVRWDPLSRWNFWLPTLLAPFTEELAKLVPLLVPSIYRDIQKANFVRYGIAIGLGFAIGEMWFIADLIARSPELGHLPFHQFGGYVGERLMTCIFHSAFVSVALWQLHSARFVLGLAGAFFLHWLLNLPLFLFFLGSGSLGAVLISLYTVFYAILSLGILGFLAFGSPLVWFSSKSVCSKCSNKFRSSWLAMNFGPFRYERCPFCQSWHWTKPAFLTSPEPVDGAGPEAAATKEEG